jgi:hypothetical protein
VHSDLLASAAAVARTAWLFCLRCQDSTGHVQTVGACESCHPFCGRTMCWGADHHGYCRSRCAFHSCSPQTECWRCRQGETRWNDSGSLGHRQSNLQWSSLLAWLAACSLRLAGCSFQVWDSTQCRKQISCPTSTRCLACCCLPEKKQCSCAPA